MRVLAQRGERTVIEVGMPPQRWQIVRQGAMLQVSADGVQTRMRRMGSDP